MSNIVRYHGESCRGPSPVLWGDISKIEDDARFGKCAFVFDDFANGSSHASAGAAGIYYTYQDTGVEIRGKTGAQDLSSELGVLEVTGNDADNDEGHISFSGYGSLARIGLNSGNTGKTIFEARVKKSTITDDEVGFFLGLCTPPVDADHLTDDDADLGGAEDWIGFHNLLDDGDAVDVVFKSSGGTKDIVLANAVTLVADDYVNLGFIFDEAAVDPSRKIVFYVNGSELDANISANTINNDTDFPEDAALAPALLTKVGQAALTETTSIDWVACAQYNDSGATV